MNLYPFINVFEKIYAKPSYYIYSMTVYHILLMVYLYFGIEGFHSQTLINADKGDILYFQQLNESILHGQMGALIFTTVLVIFEFFFLLIVRYEFPSLKLSYLRIALIEIIIVLVSLFLPQLRLVMIFLTFNTIQIMVFYRIATWVPGGKYLTISVGYILLIKILWFPIGVIKDMYLITR